MEGTCNSCIQLAGHYLYIRAVPVTQESCVGARKINSALDLVVKQVIKKEYSNNLVPIVSDHCPVNLAGMSEASKAFPIRHFIGSLKTLCSAQQEIGASEGPNILYSPCGWAYAYANHSKSIQQ